MNKEQRRVVVGCLGFVSLSLFLGVIYYADIEKAFACLIGAVILGSAAQYVYYGGKPKN